LSFWVIAEKRKYLIAREMKNGVKSGYELEYKNINGQYILRSISIYSRDEMERILFQSFIDPKKVKEGGEIIKSLKSYRVWNENKANPELISVEFELISNSKWKETKFYFYPEFNSTLKLRSTSKRDVALIRCELDTFNLLEIPTIIGLNNISVALSGI
jgi:hypothetical protein